MRIENDLVTPVQSESILFYDFFFIILTVITVSKIDNKGRDLLKEKM